MNHFDFNSELDKIHYVGNSDELEYRAYPIDATTDILSIVATLLMMKCYKEQWLLYISLNIFTIVLWSAYLINAIYGYYAWNKGAKKYETTFSSEYSRGYWQEQQVERKLPLKAFNEIALGHIQREENELIKLFF